MSEPNHLTPVKQASMLRKAPSALAGERQISPVQRLSFSADAAPTLPDGAAASECPLPAGSPMQIQGGAFATEASAASKNSANIAFFTYAQHKIQARTAVKPPPW